MSEVVTGDAVVVEVRVAQMPSRALALIIDMAVQMTVLIATYVALEAFFLVTDTALFAAVSIVLLVLVIVGYPVIFETASRGRSLGKLALGLRVVSDDGSPERFRQALFRGLAGLVEFWMFSGAPALISSLVSQRGKRLGDIFAGTIVISERGPRSDGHLIMMPPPLAAWAATLELSQLPEEVATAARQYVSRWHDLSPQIQHEVGMRIAAQVAAFVSPAAPSGVPPHAYLSAVLAERRRRDQVRLAQRNGMAPPVPPGAFAPPGAFPQPGAYQAAPQPGYQAPYRPATPPAQPYQPYQPHPQAGQPYQPQAPSVPESPPQATPGGFAPPQ
ncbi:RDD family protein [Nonomuraea aurantiaca]|uniref:RDD family protein n=1 Tax=Nonomuraea aurantiaca TaxID=2878562 RepID=UPI001CD98D5E|nr:RDD family protein [Nonomuraea aurantiaca]MCA2225556.1 RDD family protein [Nonomuraea aurantiaca]